MSEVNNLYFSKGHRQVFTLPLHIKSNNYLQVDFYIRVHRNLILVLPWKYQNQVIVCPTAIIKAILSEMNLQQLPKTISPCEYYEDQMNMYRFVEKNNSARCLNE